ncbi:MAG: S-layer homology domain-containing protein [Ruminococcaceae bacterium]|nr:S-layer homology domain-containing protein [Oscillospiraceae bacterium]
MKKLAMLLAVLMLAVAAFSVSAFEDVTVNDACFDAVNTLTSLEVIKGKTETTFAPEDPVTREQMAMLFTRLYTTVNIENGDNLTPFTDLDDPYFNSAIAWCFDAKVINGTTPTTFEPKAHIIYQDALTMACRLLGYTNLTYPLGNITKARLIGLTEGLEGTAYDKELTRGEVAIILYNALEAEGAEVIKENKVTLYNGYPLVEAIERNFEIAIDVYNFKKETYQIVATENFFIDPARGTVDEEQYGLIEIVDGEQFGDVDTYDFEEIAVAEGTVSDDNILAYIEILYRGESLDDKKAVVLSSVINSDLDAEADVEVYFKKEKSTDKEEKAQKNAIRVNGKVFDLTDADEQIVYYINGNEIKVVTDLSVDAPVFYQTKKDLDAGMYAQKIVDVDKDATPDYIMFFPMTFEKVTGISTKGVYKFETSGEFKTEEEECTLVINAEEVAKGDYVLTYKYGPFTVVDSVVEPLVTTITRRTGSSLANYKYTLATGDVVTFADANYPVAGTYMAAKKLDASNKEDVFYIINDKIIYTEKESATGYEAYSYAFFIQGGEVETSVDTEDGTVTDVNTIIAFMNGKAVTLPVEADKIDDLTPKSVITVTDIKDGKYIVENGMVAADKIAADNEDGYEHQFASGSAQIWYDTNSNIYKLSANSKIYNIGLTADSELYAVNMKNGNYDSVKRYTMANMPKYGKTTLTNVIIAAVKDADEKITGWNLLVAYIADASLVGDTNNEYQDYRIVLSAGEEIDDEDNTYTVYEVLNPVTGATETIVDTTANSTIWSEGTLVRKANNGSVKAVINEDVADGGKYEVFNANNLQSGADTRKLMQINKLINDDTFATVFKGLNQGEMGDPGEYSQEIKLNGVNIVVIDIDEDTDEITVEVTEDATELEGKVVRTFVTSGLSYKPAYMVILPWQWVDAEGDFAGFANLDEYYDDYEEEVLA